MQQDGKASCRFCGCTEGRSLFPREMYHGTRKSYEYLHCNRCGALSCREDVPADEAYPRDYFSFQRIEIKTDFSTKLRSFYRRIKTPLLLSRDSPVQRAAIALFSEHYLFPWFRMAKIKASSSIIDVGCGTGAILLYLKDCGFRSLNGVDPFIEADVMYESGLSIQKKALEDLEEKFDFILFHHVIEHMADPGKTLARAGGLLKEGGHILIITPVSDCYAFRKYGPFWASLDAPRHLAIPTNRSMHLIAETADLRIAGVGFMSSDFQFRNSELYLADISAVEMAAGKSKEGAAYSPEQQKAFLNAAKWLDGIHDGDTAVFLLEKK